MRCAGKDTSIHISRFVMTPPFDFYIYNLISKTLSYNSKE